MRKRTIASKRVITLGELRTVLESLTLQRGLYEVLLENSQGEAPMVQLIEETLSDGSKVYNIRIA